MQWTDQAAAFLQKAGPFLARNEPENSIILGHPLRDHEARFAYAGRGGRIEFAAALNANNMLTLAHGSDSDLLPLLTESLKASGQELHSVGGYLGLAEEVAKIWAQPFRADSIALYRLDALHPARPVSGELRPARADDLPVLASWRQGNHHASVPTPRLVVSELAGLRSFVWAVDGRPMAMASHLTTGVHSGAGRIVDVFTAEESRQKGYGSALVAALCRHLEQQQETPVLIAVREANDPARRVYERIGFSRIATYQKIIFGPFI